MKSSSARLFGFLFVVSSAGCGRYYDIGRPDGARGEVVVFMPGRHAHFVCITCGTDNSDTADEDVRYYRDPRPFVVLPASRRDAVDERRDRPPFNPRIARAALNRADVSSCRDAGAPAGFGHARLLISPDGYISKVVIDTPSGMTSEAVQCIGDRLGAVTVPAFDGSIVTMGTTYYVP